MTEQNKNQEPEVMDDDQALNYTQGVRKKLIEATFVNNKIPDDKGHQIILLQALDGMDRAALGNKRIKTDAASNDVLAESSSLIAQMLNTIGSKLTKRDESEIVDVDFKPPVLGPSIPEPELVPGETEIGAKQLDYDSFMSNANRNKE